MLHMFALTVVYTILLPTGLVDTVRFSKKYLTKKIEFDILFG